MGLFSSIFGGGKQKKAVTQAAQIQADALNRSTDIGNQQYQQTRDDYMPYTLAGRAAIGRYADLSGANGDDALRVSVDSLKQDPFFQQNLADANTNLLQSASATGGVRGGNTAGAVGELSPQLLQAYYQKALGNYQTLSQLGLGATGNVAQFGAANAQNAGQNAVDIGNTQAGSILTKAGINSANFNNIGNFLGQAASSVIPGSLGKALGSIF